VKKSRVLAPGYSALQYETGTPLRAPFFKKVPTNYLPLVMLNKDRLKKVFKRSYADKVHIETNNSEESSLWSPIIVGH